MLDERQRVALGAGLRIFAIRVARASDDTAGDVRLLDAETGFFQRSPECGHVAVRHVRDDEILPDSQAHFAIAIHGAILLLGAVILAFWYFNK